MGTHGTAMVTGLRAAPLVYLDTFGLCPVPDMCPVMLSAMTPACHVEHRDRYTVVRIDAGEPALDAFLAIIALLGTQAQGWPNDCVLVDLRSVRTLKSAAEHQAVGQAVVRHFAHVRRMASVVPADRITRASEKTAQRGGVDLRVFTGEGEAISWLTG